MSSFKTVIGTAAILLLMTLASSAFGTTSSWQEGRKICEDRLAKEGKLEDKEEMRKCCDNMILVADLKENRRLVEMCTTNGKAAGSGRTGRKK